MRFHRLLKNKGFTLVELLIVLAIIGTLVLVVVPQVGGGMAATRISTAARSVVQASRYARTMALLNQTETELSLFADGTVEVKAALASSQRVREADLLRREAAADFQLSPESVPVSTNSKVEVSTSLALADEINARFENSEMTFEFVGYTDTVDEEEEISLSEAASGDEDETGRATQSSSVIAKVLYESNGICRPYHVRLLHDDGISVDVFIDITGAGRIVAEEEP